MLLQKSKHVIIFNNGSCKTYSPTLIHRQLGFHLIKQIPLMRLSSYGKLMSENIPHYSQHHRNPYKYNSSKNYVSISNRNSIRRTYGYRRQPSPKKRSYTTTCKTNKQEKEN